MAQCKSAFLALLGVLVRSQAGIVPEYGLAGPGLAFGSGLGNGYGPGVGNIGAPVHGVPLFKPAAVPYAGVAHYARPIVQPFYPHRAPYGYGGEEVDKTVFGGSKKALTGEHYEKFNGKEGQHYNQGEGGYHNGKALVKNDKGDSAYYSDVAEGKKLAEDAKLYHGGEHFNKDANEGIEKKVSRGHKKGRVVKGFKNSHHKDEKGHSEQYYDENHDEGDESAFGGHSGSYGEEGGSSYKGGHEDGQLYANEHKNSGHYGKEHLVDHAGVDHGKYGGNRFQGSGTAYGKANGVDEHALQGHHESERVLKNKPFYGYY